MSHFTNVEMDSAWTHNTRGKNAHHAGLLPLVAPSESTVGHSAAQTKPTGQMDLRTYGVGAQILRELGVARLRILGSPRRMPSMMGYGLEVLGFEGASA